MERAEILTAMFELKLFGMKSAFDEIIATAVKRQHKPQRIVGDLLTAEIAMKHRGSPIVAMHGKIGTLAAFTEGPLPPETGSQDGDLDEET